MDGDLGGHNGYPGHDISILSRWEGAKKTKNSPQRHRDHGEIQGLIHLRYSGCVFAGLVVDFSKTFGPIGMELLPRLWYRNVYTGESATAITDAAQVRGKTSVSLFWDAAYTQRRRVMLSTARAVVRDGKIELQEPMDLPEGAPVLVTLLVDEDTLFWSRVGHPALDAVWDNAEDDIYAQLLKE